VSDPSLFFCKNDGQTFLRMTFKKTDDGSIHSKSQAAKQAAEKNSVHRIISRSHQHYLNTVRNQFQLGIQEIFILNFTKAMPDTSSIENLFPALRPDDGKAHISHGSDAALQALRSFQTQQLEIQPLVDEEENEKEQLLHHLNSTSITITLPFLLSPSLHVKSQIFITTKRVFIVAHDEAQANYDISMNAYCISLHALMSEPTRSLYCQLSEEVEVHGDMHVQSTDGDDENVMACSKEITIEPILEDGDSQVSCQELFDSLSKLMHLNPVEDEDENGFGSGGGGGLAAMLGMMANAYGEEEGDDDGDGMICRIDPSQMITAESLQNEERGGALSAERQKMLEKLDNVLFVPPEYAVAGQFDDADEELDSGDDRIL
jgi:hypothetical protein